ncbi:MAG: hypothetical protein V4645_27775 [Pseudomonadota bacterium]
MHPKSALLFAAFALYGAPGLAAPYSGMCTATGDGGKTTFDGGCTISKTLADGKTTYRIEPSNRRPLLLVTGPGTCSIAFSTSPQYADLPRLGPKPCIEDGPASRPDGVRYRIQDGGTLEFTLKDQ